MSQAELMALPQPAMANILRYMVGEWGAAFINIGLIISIIGCWLSWTMLPVETTLLMSRDGMLPKVGARSIENKHQVIHCLSLLH